MVKVRIQLGAGACTASSRLSCCDCSPIRSPCADCSRDCQVCQSYAGGQRARFACGLACSMSLVLLNLMIAHKYFAPILAHLLKLTHTCLAAAGTPLAAAQARVRCSARRRQRLSTAVSGSGNACGLLSWAPALSWAPMAVRMRLASNGCFVVRPSNGHVALSTCFCCLLPHARSRRCTHAIKPVPRQFSSGHSKAAMRCASTATDTGGNSSIGMPHGCSLFAVVPLHSLHMISRNQRRGCACAEHDGEAGAGAHRHTASPPPLPMTGRTHPKASSPSCALSCLATTPARTNWLPVGWPRRDVFRAGRH